MTGVLRNRLRASLTWVRFRELQREGFIEAWRRWRIQKKILATAPIMTDHDGSLEVRLVTWRRDWVNAIWALKSFYLHAGQRLPLHIHDGGLLPDHIAQLRRHFPHATVIEGATADKIVCAELEARGLRRCLAYRRKNAAARKIFDYAIFSTARRIISIDSDIVFFRRADELLDPDDHVSRFNRDMAYAYSLPQEDLNRLSGCDVPPLINSGLFAVDRASIDLKQVDMWLEDERLFADEWVTEQTLHAMLAARSGVALLDARYKVSAEQGILEGLICKHYPGFYRRHLYLEGYAQARVT